MTNSDFSLANGWLRTPYEAIESTIKRRLQGRNTTLSCRLMQVIVGFFKGIKDGLYEKAGSHPTGGRCPRDRRMLSWSFSLFFS